MAYKFPKICIDIFNELPASFTSRGKGECALFDVALKGETVYELGNEEMMFNKGVSGRGRKIIPPLKQESIAEMMTRADYLNQDLIRFI